MTGLASGQSRLSSHRCRTILRRPDTPLPLPLQNPEDGASRGKFVGIDTPVLDHYCQRREIKVRDAAETCERLSPADSCWHRSVRVVVSRMEFRRANNGDRAAIESLIFPILRSYGLEPSPESTDADLSDLESHYFQNGGIFEVLVDGNDRIFGSVAIHRTGPGLCELRKMYLSPDLRGQGWGRKLLERAIQLATELGYGQIWLESADSLKEARRLYESHGFTPFEAPHCSARCDFAMSRRL